ncbi:sugar ABC transporter permease [Anaerolineales bacterium HSG6]|nr:sugar ABC transporter permease [Anaerolineales bacterium HSG6]MDM8531608.1 sugar ABC transporter permease [Anaerolineales bacterium HSG25]
MSFISELQKVLRENIRDYGMFIALFVIMAFFTAMTDGIFISSRNISNLLNQTGYIAVLGVGMMLIIVIRHIDLSVGFLSGFLGALAAIALETWGLSVYIVLPMILLLGTLAGAATGTLVAVVGIPAFVASLAGFLIYRGAILVALQKTGTIIITDETFNAIGNGYIPDIPGLDTFLPGVHKLTILLGIVAVVLYVMSEIKNRNNKKAYNFEVLSMNIFVLKLVFVAGLIGSVTWILAGFRGLSWTVVLVIIVVSIYHFVTTQTVLGRHIYAVGGNPEAAELSGISVRNTTYAVFCSMGMLSGLSGIMFASRLQSATMTAGTLFELDAIAAAFVGGASATGGVGKVTGALVGALVMTSLTSGMNLMSIDISYQYMVRGVVLAAAVIFDVATRGKA